MSDKHEGEVVSYPEELKGSDKCLSRAKEYTELTQLYYERNVPSGVEYEKMLEWLDYAINNLEVVKENLEMLDEIEE